MNKIITLPSDSKSNLYSDDIGSNERMLMVLEHNVDEIILQRGCIYLHEIYEALGVK